MCCPVSPKGNLAVRVSVAVCSLFVLAAMLTAIAVPYVKVPDRTSYFFPRSVNTALFYCTIVEDWGYGWKTYSWTYYPRDNSPCPISSEEIAAVVFEIIAAVFSLLSLTVTIILVAIQVRWNSARPCMANVEPVLVLIVVVANAVVAESCVIALGIMGHFVRNVIEYAYVGFFVLIPGLLFSLTALVLSAIPPCMGYTCYLSSSHPAEQQPGPVAKSQSYPHSKASEPYGPNAGGTASYV